MALSTGNGGRGVESPTNYTGVAQADKVMAHADNALTVAARVACQSAERGNLRELEHLLPSLASTRTAELRAWDFTLRAIRWSFDPSHDEAPDPDKAGRLAQGGKTAAEILSRACVVMERIAFHTFNRPLLGEWTALHATLLADGAAEESAASISLAAARLWDRLLAGDTEGLDKAAEQLSNQAQRQKAPAEAIESTVIRALLALSAGALSEATELARLASRSAQSESLPQHEYLANIVLARVRRYSERPHLALHILAALDRVTPRTWSGWIGWETLLAGGSVSPPAHDGAGTLAVTPSMVTARCLSNLLEAARAGNREAFVEVAAKVEQAASAWPHLAREATALLAVLDPERRTVPDSIASWQRGQTATIPYGLHGVGIPQDSDLQAETATAYVLARPSERGRRFLSLGLALVHDARVLTRDSPSSGARTETGLAALALAGEAGDSRDGFFRSVYGFPFVSHRHQAVLDMLCHRMRTLLGASGEIHRRGGDSGAAPEPEVSPASTPDGPSLSLSLRVPIVVPDMRCALPSADRVLRALATMGASSATAAADSLRMPLRTVQAVLQQLVAERACTLERDGRHVSYRIDDTTFTEVNLT